MGEMKESLFWADQLAKEAIERAERENTIVTCRSGASPSGAKHIGNLFDVLKSYIVHKAVLDAGFKSRFVLTHDDRDPIRKIPPRLPDLDGNWCTTEDIAKKMQGHLGEPYCNAPDPFGCCKSWSKHFATVWENGIRALGVDMQTYYNNDLYNRGDFELFIITALKKLEISRKVIMQFQETKDKNYIPFDVICENCGKIIGRATGFDLEQKTIDYVCEKKMLGGKYEIDGCGHHGTTTFNGGKLPWSFEWPAQWLIFKTTFEPFGKEHAEGSWPRCSAICKSVYSAEPPIPHIYEFLLVNGAKMAARAGNAYVVQDMLKILEPEIFFYFYTKRSTRQRNLDIENIYYLVDEFEKAENVYYGKESLGPKDDAQIKRMYALSWQPPKEQPIRVPYTFASLIAQIVDPNKMVEQAVTLLKSTGHLDKDVSKEQRKQIEKRLLLAKHWVENYAPTEMRITLNEEPPNVRLNHEQRSAMIQLISKLEMGLKEKELEREIYDVAKSHGIDTKTFFALLYNILISRERGPRLAPFIIVIGEERVAELLKKVV